MDRIKNIIFELFFILLALTSAGLAAIIGSFPIFKWDINYLQLDLIVNLTPQQIWHNYLQLMNYLMVPWNNKLQMTNFPSSHSGLEHFIDVKDLFGALALLWLICIIVIIVLLIKKKFKTLVKISYSRIKTLLLVPPIIAIYAAFDFDGLFFFFHKSLFRNNDWLFDPMKDPVINILPDTFFAHCFALAFIVFELVVIGLLFYGRDKKSKH